MTAAVRFSRRIFLSHACLLAGAPYLVQPGSSSAVPASEPMPGNGRFIYCLNTATIRGQKLGIVT